MKHIMKRHKFTSYIEERFFLRFHMSLILTATALSGLLATKVLLLLNVREMLIRYPLAVVFSYLVFFVLIKIWLWYISFSSNERKGSIVEKTMEAVGDFPVDLSVNLPSSGGGPFSFGGGSSGGGGASAGFDTGGSSILDSSSEIVSSAGKGVGNAVGDAASGIFDDEGGLVLVVLGLLIAAIFGASLYLIYSAPAVLSEAAFEALMATTLLKATRRIDEPDWMGSVLRATIVPFIIIFLLSLLLAGTIESYWPDAAKLADVWK